MEYYEAANRLYDLGRFGIKPGTASTADILAHLGNPHESIDAVQIAGSNGKGSTARMLESVLREAGLSVGLYTSPHLVDMRERIRVDGRKIPKRAVAQFVEACEEYLIERGADGASPTFFEATTAMACWHFAREGVDVAVLEVGIGGKLDATSVVDPVASAVTSVTLEHTDILGDTIEEIARDKAHVAGEHPLVTATTGEALRAIREVAGEVVTVRRDSGSGADGDETTATAPDVSVTYGGRANHTESRVTIERDGHPLETRVAALGAHQAENAGIAATLAKQVTDVTDQALSRGLRKAYWPGRLEVMETNPLVVLDGAHTPDACEQLAAVCSTFEYDDLHLVVAALHDKDHRAMAEALPTADRVTACRPANERAVTPDVLARVFENAGVDAVQTVSAVQDAFGSALETAEEDDCVVVAGSLYAVAEARTRYTNTSTPTQVRDLGDAREALESAGVTEKGVYRMRGKAVHRVVKTDLQYRQAAYLKQELLSLGGECALSGLQRDEERTEAVMMGTLAQFKRLTEKLSAQPYGLAEVGRDIRDTLEIGVEPPKARYPWQYRTAVMGILNVTPDSFHDGGRYDVLSDAVTQAEAMAGAGADVIDVGGESTRPGADPVSIEAEIERVVPVIERLAGLDALISVDTRKAAVAEAALDAGADIVNDVSGLEDPEMRFVVAEHDAPVILMHSIDAPVVPDREVTYDDVVADVIDELTERVLLAEKAGLDREQIVVDPGIGFGKRSRESFELLDRLDEFRALDCSLLVGHSHKSMFDRIGCGPDERLAPTIAATALAADRGADIIRVHDVPENVAAVKTALATRRPYGWTDSTE